MEKMLEQNNKKFYKKNFVYSKKKLIFRIFVSLKERKRERLLP